MLPQGCHRAFDRKMRALMTNVSRARLDSLKTGIWGIVELKVPDCLRRCREESGLCSTSDDETARSGCRIEQTSGKWRFLNMDQSVEIRFLPPKTKRVTGSRDTDQPCRRPGPSPASTDTLA